MPRKVTNQGSHTLFPNHFRALSHNYFVYLRSNYLTLKTYRLMRTVCDLDVQLCQISWRQQSSPPYFPHSQVDNPLFTLFNQNRHKRPNKTSTNDRKVAKTIGFWLHQTNKNMPIILSTIPYFSWMLILGMRPSFLRWNSR